MNGLVPTRVLESFGFEDPDTMDRMSGGIINTTVLVIKGQRRAVFQRVHPVFPPEVTLDVADVTDFLDSQGFPVFKVMRTNKGTMYMPDQDGHWRALTWLDSTGRLPTPYEAGITLGRFHSALFGWDHEFRHVRIIHQPIMHANTLAQALGEHRSHRHHKDVAVLAREITGAIEALAARVDLGLTGVVHGDPKLENFLEVRGQGWTLVDLDTVGHKSVLAELGDALRSWCNQDNSFSQERFDSALEGYLSTTPYRDLDRTSLLDAAALISWELAARFAADALNESYFAWDPDAYATRGDHNLARARDAVKYARTIPVESLKVQ